MPELERVQAEALIARPQARPMLELQGARKLYESPGEVVHAVEDVSMSVRERELVARLGASGPGSGRPCRPVPHPAD